MNGRLENNALLTHIADNLFDKVYDSDIITVAMRYLNIKHNLAPPLSIRMTGTGNNDRTLVESIFTEAFDGRECIILHGVGSFIPAPEGFVTLDKPPYPVSQFISKTSPTQIYVNTQKKRAIVLV